MSRAQAARNGAFRLDALRQARLDRGLTLRQVARKIGVSAPQVQRIEAGDRQLSLSFLEDYCDALDIHLLDLFSVETQVPIMGVVDDTSNILPVPAGTPTSVKAPRLVSNPERLAAIRWKTASVFQAMENYIGFFYADSVGIPADAWGCRCILRRSDGSHRLGWPYQEDGQIHILAPGVETELNASLEWASPVLGVFAPQTLG